MRSVPPAGVGTASIAHAAIERGGERGVAVHDGVLAEEDDLAKADVTHAFA